MNYKELAQAAQAHAIVLTETIKTMEHSFKLQSQTLKTLTKTNESLLAEISELKAIILAKDGKNEKLANQLNGLAKIALPKKVEKRKCIDTTLKSTKPAPTPKERGNNGAKRKVYNTLEEIIEEVEPSHEEFIEQRKNAKFISFIDVVRYKFIPPKLIKYIYRCNKYALNDTVFEGKAPIAPFLNSNFDSSVIANLMQQRFIYGLPVERIVRYLSEVGMDIPKPTAHGLIAKGAELLDKLLPVLKNAILLDDYVNFDETHYTVLDTKSVNGSRKGYLWVVFSNRYKLIHYFIDERASRSKTAFTSYLPPTYNGAIQTDGNSSYKVLDTWEYKHAIRLGCIQHCKRYFLEIQEQEKAKEFIGIYNEFYLIRKHQPKEDWVKSSKLVFEKLELRLNQEVNSPETIANTKLATAINYSLNELESIRNIIVSENYQLDNNSVERSMRYISISRRNSMFCGSVEGARRMALIYSLAISCRLNNVNSFLYFSDVLNKLATLPINPDQSQLRNLLPDKWEIEDV